MRSAIIFLITFLMLACTAVFAFTQDPIEIAIADLLEMPAPAPDWQSANEDKEVNSKNNTNQDKIIDDNAPIAALLGYWSAVAQSNHELKPTEIVQKRLLA